VFRDKPQAFLALPFNKSSPLYQQIGSALASSGIQPVSPEAAASGAVLSEHVQSAIRSADVVVADLTGKNPYVLFEVGVAFGLGKPVLLLSQEPLTDVPFDLKAHQIAVYRPDDMGTVRRYVELWLRDVLAHQQSAS
jgi:nucleoside 2-deoxyribosyltransferase